MSDQSRIESLEKEVVELKIRMKVNEINITAVTMSVNEIKKNTNKLVWLVGSALILTILNYIIKGGFTQ